MMKKNITSQVWEVFVKLFLVVSECIPDSVEMMLQLRLKHRMRIVAFEIVHFVATMDQRKSDRD